MKDLSRLLGTESSKSLDEYKRCCFYGTLKNSDFGITFSDNSKILFIDTENVRNYDFLSELSPRDEVNFIYTSNSPGLRYNFLEEIMSSGVQCNFIKSSNGMQNALDFVLVTSLTEFVVMNKDYLSSLNLYVISNDKGYYSTVKYLSDKYKDINLFIVIDNK